MQLIKIEADNVFSLGKVQLDLLNKGLLLVTGYSNDDNNGNGAGKSSLANHAIVWGLYGQTYDGSKGDAVINRNSGKSSGSVAITFNGIDGRLYKIIRTRNPNSLKLIDLTSTGIFHPDIINDVSHRLERETQETINRLLGRDFHTFIHSDLIGPGTERSFFKLTGAEQVSILESVLPIKKLEVWAEVAKANAKAVRDDYNAKKYELALVEGKKQAVEDQIASLKNQHEQWWMNNTIEMNKTKELLIAAEKVEQSKADKIAALSADLIVLRYNLPIAPLLKGDPLNTQQKLVVRQAELQNDIRGLVALSTSSVCQLCGQAPPAETVKGATQKLELAKEELAAITADLNIVNDCISKGNQIEKIKDEINKLSSTSNETLMNVYRERIEACKKATSPYIGSIEAITESVEKYKNIIEIAKGIMEVYEEDLKWLDFWAKGCSTDLRTMMIEEICPFLEERINDYLVKLNNPQFKATVSTVKSLKSGDIREKFNLEVRSSHGADSFALLSVGEKQLVSFAVSLAIADLASTQVRGQSFILILDEPFMGLHKNNCENIVQFLNTYNRKTILLISNEDEIKSLVHNRIKVVKTKGVSWLE